MPYLGRRDESEDDDGHHGVKRTHLMLMVLVAGVLVALVIGLSAPRFPCHFHSLSVEGDDAQLHRLCQMIRHDDPDWWERHCKI